MLVSTSQIIFKVFHQGAQATAVGNSPDFIYTRQRMHNNHLLLGFC